GVALGVVRDPRAQLRVVVEHLVDVFETARPRLAEAHPRARVDEAGIDVGPGRIDRLRAGRDRDPGADRVDLAAADHDRAALDGRLRDRMNRGVDDRPDWTGGLGLAAGSDGLPSA